MRSAFARVLLSSRLLLCDLYRRRLVIVLLVTVPALFHAVALLTAPSRKLQVTLASLVEDGAPRVRPAFDLDVLDNGQRTVDERELTLVFLGHAAVCFLACFLAFHLIHQRRAADARLVLSGYRAWEVLAAKLLVLLLLGLLLSLYEAGLMSLWLTPHHALVLGLGLFLGGLIYGAVGLLTATLVRQEIEGIFVMMFWTNVDPGWLQNPIYFADTEWPTLLRALPGHASAQLSILGALDASAPNAVALQAFATLVVLLAFAFGVFWWRIRPVAERKRRGAPEVIESDHERRLSRRGAVRTES
jgi:hypothetical protein